MIRGGKDVDTTPQMKNTDREERMVVVQPMRCGLNLSLSAAMARRDTTSAAVREGLALSPVFGISIMAASVANACA